jgi:outer membrane cobalamin receptor
MNKIYLKGLIAILGLLPAYAVQSQELNGTVYYIEQDGRKTTLPGANIYLKESRLGTTTDADGHFVIRKTGAKEEYLLVSFTGYRSDSVLVNSQTTAPLEFVLAEGMTLGEAVVTAYRQGTTLSALTTLKTETITEAGLMKMACCNLSESFENSATVTVGFTDAVSGAKQVQLLGLSGIYSQMLAENVPTLRGLAATYGWSYTPGTWLESIQISKGASSVVNGYESITGQINLEFRKPNLTDPLFINLYTDDAGRYETNLSTAVPVAKNLWTGLMLHGSIESEVHDNNGDTFMDMPKTQFINAYNRWFYLDAERGIQSRTGIKFLYDERKGGQDSLCHEGEGPLFETFITNKNLTVYNKTGIAVGDKEDQSIGIINSFTHHTQNSDFGKKTFDGTQTSYYANIMFFSHIGTPVHSYTAGVSFAYDRYATQYADLLPFNQTPLTPINRTEAVPGAYGEYTFAPAGGLTLLLGFRTDYNSRYGWLVTPRANIRYNFGEWLILRASGGRGFRAPNIIPDNIGILASSRNIHVEDIHHLGIEKAWNWGGNATFYIPIWDERRITLSLDYFRTAFQNQAITDIERDRHDVFFYNLRGRSFANAWQADLSMTFFRGLDLFAAFRYNTNRITYSDGEQSVEMEKPLVSRYRGLVNLSYATNFKRWMIDLTAQFNGPARLPGMNGYRSQEAYSPAFPVYFAQATKNSKRFDIYIGVENLFDYKQKDPIYGWNNPFNEEFDSSLIWGPLMGRKLYAGIRWRIGKLK